MKITKFLDIHIATINNLHIDFIFKIYLWYFSQIILVRIKLCLSIIISINILNLVSPRASIWDLYKHESLIGQGGEEAKKHFKNRLISIYIFFRYFKATSKAIHKTLLQWRHRTKELRCPLVQTFVPARLRRQQSWRRNSVRTVRKSHALRTKERGIQDRRCLPEPTRRLEGRQRTGLQGRLCTYCWKMVFLRWLANISFNIFKTVINYYYSYNE